MQAVRDALPELNTTMRRVAEEILADPVSAGSASITDLADRASAPPATVSRLATRLGYKGFPALRSALAEENGRHAQAGWENDIGSGIGRHDPAEDVLNVLAGTAARALRDAASSIDTSSIKHAAEVLAAAERIFLYGEWGDYVALRELQMRLQRIGLSATFIDGGPTTVRELSKTMTSKDAVVVLNRDGSDAVIPGLLHQAQTRGATTIAFHGAPRSPVADAADIPIFSGIQNGEVWTQYYSGRVSDTLATSFLWVLVAQKCAGNKFLKVFDNNGLDE